MVDFNKKILNSNKFRQAALHFQKHGCYLFSPKGTSEYIKYWEEEEKRCLEGYTAEDGDFITGYHYFYLNYCPIQRITEIETKLKSGEVVKRKTKGQDFPDFYDYDYYFFCSVEEAEIEGKHMVVLKARRKGYSFKCSAMMCRNYYMIPNSKSYAYASEAEFLVKDGIITKAWEYMDFIDEHTAWSKKRQKIDTKMHRRSSVVVTDNTGNKIEVGYKSDIIGVTVKNDIQKVRGKAGKLILFEEAGKFPNLLEAWNIARSSVEQDGYVYGTMIAFGTGGCVCAGTKVRNNKGELVNIEELKQEDGIIGFNGITKTCSLENITYLQKPTKKLCYRLTTNIGRTLECSEDHPILIAKQRNNTGNILGTKFVETDELKVGNWISVIDNIDIFGSESMWNPRVIGWLIGDGTYGKSQTPRLSNCEPEILSYIHSNFETHINKTYITKLNKVYEEINIKNICDKLRNIGIYGQTKDNKRLPNNYDKYRKEDLLELIGGLWDTDGYVNLRKNKKRNTYIAEISISSACFELLIEILYLLNKFGIHGKIRERLPRKTNPKDKNSWFELVIADKKSLVVFAKNIKLFPKIKQERLNKILEVYTNIKSNAVHEGIRFEKLISIENIGIKDVYNLTANNTNTYIANGIITHNTEGANFDSVKELFERPEGYGVKAFSNIWDENAQDTKCGFFVPYYANLNAEFDGKPLMDNDGNSNVSVATQFALAQRQPVIENAKDKNALDRYVAEYPLTPAESMLQISGNIFPKKLLLEQLAFVKTHTKVQNLKQVGDLEWSENGLKWEVKKHGDIVNFPLSKADDPTGAIVIWEHPCDNPPYGLYIAGCLTPGEKVYTDKGLKNVENVTLYDKLINKDGESVKINTLLRYLKEDEKIYKVKMSNSYRTTTFTQEHPLYISKTSYNSNKTLDENTFDFNFIRMRNVEVGDWIKYPNIYRNTNNSYYIGGTPFISNDFWWFVGLWLGDGYCNVNKKSTSIYLNALEFHTIEKLKDTITKSFGLKYSERTRNGCTEINIYHERLAKWLTSTFGSTAKYKNIPENIRKMPNRDSAKLILGFLDSDGSVYKSGKYYVTEFTSISLDLIEALHGMMLGLGYIGNISKLRSSKKSIINGRIINQDNCFHLRFGHQDTIGIYNELIELDSENIKLNRITNLELFRNRPRKGMFLSKDLKYVYIQIKEIEESLYTGIVYNFDCDTHSFITQYCTTHNCDPYDHDQSGTSSLGSTFIFKRSQNFENNFETIVAEYTGRPERADIYYENVRKLLTYYNAKMMYENERKGLFVYFHEKHCDYLLADQPSELLRDILDNSKVNRGKGIHMNQEIKLFGEGELKEWLCEEYEPGKPNVKKILSIPLLEELINFNDTGNYDRVMSMITLVLYRRFLINMQVKRKEETVKYNKLFEGPLFELNLGKDITSGNTNDVLKIFRN